MDYFCATSMVMYLLFACLMRYINSMFYLLFLLIHVTRQFLHHSCMTGVCNHKFSFLVHQKVKCHFLYLRLYYGVAITNY